MCYSAVVCIVFGVSHCRYDAVKNELVCDKLGVAYLILGKGVPNLYPQDGRIMSEDEKTSS